jgi:hypothetical protein
LVIEEGVRKGLSPNFQRASFMALAKLIAQALRSEVKNHTLNKNYQTNTDPPIRLKPGDSGGIIWEWAKATFLLINLEAISSMVRWDVTRI